VVVVVAMAVRLPLHLNLDTTAAMIATTSVWMDPVIATHWNHVPWNRAP
jgi:hypothetical protein